MATAAARPPRRFFVKMRENLREPVALVSIGSMHGVRCADAARRYCVSGETVRCCGLPRARGAHSLRIARGRRGNMLPRGAAAGDRRRGGTMRWPVPKRLRDLSLRHKILLANFLMVLVPVLLIAVLGMLLLAFAFIVWFGLSPRGSFSVRCSTRSRGGLPVRRAGAAGLSETAGDLRLRRPRAVMTALLCGKLGYRGVVFAKLAHAL